MDGISPTGTHDPATARPAGAGPATADAAPTTPDQHKRLPYQPALDGLRAVAVIMVVLFHGGWSRFSGGYVGVSLFFTLSGFLITSLLVLEHERARTISLPRFFTRRVKRLMPASLVCLAAVSVFAAFGRFRSAPGLRGDVVASALEVANWRALLQGDSYARLVGAAQPGPVDHFWSLSIEEQFYWLWPLAALGIFAVFRSHRARAVAVTILAALVAATAVFVAHVWGPDAAYYATPARLGEILVGAAFGMWVVYRPPRGRWVGPAGWVGLGIVVCAAMTWPSGSGPAYAGALPFLALASGTAIVAATGPGSFRTALSAGALVALGRISFGVYVFHWPVFALVTRRSVGIGGPALFAVRVLITLAVSIGSYSFLERRFRRSATPPGRTAVLAAGATALVVALALALIPSPREQFIRAVDTGRVGLGGTADPGGPQRIAIIGDSAAVALGSGAVAWAEEDPTRARVAVVAQIGCGLARVREVPYDENGALHRACVDTLGPQLDDVLGREVDTAVITVALMDNTRLLWDEREGWLDPGDPRHQAHLLADYEAMVDRLRAADVQHINWVVSPRPTPWWFGWQVQSPETFTTQPLLDTITTVAERHPDLVDVVRLDEWVLSRESGDSSELRPDGIHLGAEGAKRVMDELLGDELLAATAPGEGLRP